jgi:hypothetical protein
MFSRRQGRPAVHTTRSQVRIPTATLLALLGEGHISPASFRRSKIERFWPCGCVVTYAYDRYDDADWTPCEKHNVAVR